MLLYQGMNQQQILNCLHDKINWICLFWGFICCRNTGSKVIIPVCLLTKTMIESNKESYWIRQSNNNVWAVIFKSSHLSWIPGQLAASTNLEYLGSCAPAFISEHGLSSEEKIQVQIISGKTGGVWGDCPRGVAVWWCDSWLTHSNG